MDKNQQIISVEADATIYVKAHGNLDVLGWERPEVGILTDINVQKIRQEKKVLRLLFVEDCELSIPADVNLVVDRVSGDARFRRLNGALEIRKLLGNAAFQRVANVSTGKISADCLIENVSGPVNISRIGGDLKGKNIQSELRVERVSGKVKLHLLAAGVDLRGSEQVEVSLAEDSQGDVRIKTSGDILAHLPVNPDAKVSVKSGGEKIELDVGEYSEVINENRCEMILGKGSRKISLESSEKVRVTGDIFDEKEILKLCSDLDVLWTKLSEQSVARRTAKSDEVHWEIKIVEGAAKIAQETMEGLGEMAGQIAEETIVKAESHVQTALQQVEEQIRNLGYDVWVEEDDLEIERSSVTAEEKLIVMKLLEEQKISVEEADRLLEVLEETTD